MRCKNCRYWVGGCGPSEDVDEPGDKGECRRNAPKPLSHISPSLEEDLPVVITVWPYTFEFDGCGEFVPKDE